MSTKIRATVEDLYHVPEHGKAELVNGELVRFMPTGMRPSRASSRIWRSLNDHEQASGGGMAIGDNAGFIVDLPDRESFSPDAAWYTGQDTGMRFMEGAPVFAAEVRSENDYGPAAEREMADKRRDYFAAGTPVGWDVNPLTRVMGRAYRVQAIVHTVSYPRGETVAS